MDSKLQGLGNPDIVYPYKDDLGGKKFTGSRSGRVIIVSNLPNFIRLR